jgi:hypothetical protein
MGFLSSVVNGVGNVVSGAVNTVGDLASGAVNAVEDVGHTIDQTVRSVIPGGWGTIGAGALLAVGITDPSLLSAADSGTLTSDAIANAGLDPTTVASQVSQVSPEVASETAGAYTGPGIGEGSVAPATDAQGNTLVSEGSAGKAPVYDAAPATPGVNNTLGAANPTLAQGLSDYAGAVGSSLGTAGLLGAGALGGAALANALSPSSSPLTGQVGSGNVNYTWGQGTPLVSGGLNPGYIGGAASVPYYNTGNPTDAQYYWGVHAPVMTAADLANYNQQAGAPATPWGAGAHAVGGQGQFNPADFVNQYILNPGWTGVNNATSPGYTGPAVPAKG